MKRKRDRSESGQLRNKINRWVRFLSKERDWDYVFHILTYLILNSSRNIFNSAFWACILDCTPLHTLSS